MGIFVVVRLVAMHGSKEGLSVEGARPISFEKLEDLTKELPFFESLGARDGSHYFHVAGAGYYKVAFAEFDSAFNEQSALISARAADEGVELGDVRLFVRCVDGKITVPDPPTMRSLSDD